LHAYIHLYGIMHPYPDLYIFSLIHVSVIALIKEDRLNNSVSQVINTSSSKSDI